MAQVQDPNHPDGVYEDKSEKTTADLERSKSRKGIAALELYSRIFSWTRVAEVIGFPSARAAQISAERALEIEFHESPQSQDFMRKYVTKSLDNMLASLASKISDPNHPEHLAAIKTARDLLLSKSKLLGLDAPTRISMVDPTTEEIEAFINDRIGPSQLPDDYDVLGSTRQIESEIAKEA